MTHTIELTEQQLNTVLAALILASTRYDPHHNGGIHYDFAFKTMEQQEQYAGEFVEVGCEIRSQTNQEA